MIDADSVQWTYEGNQSVTLDFNTGSPYPTISEDQSRKFITFEDYNSFRNGFYASAEGDVCQNFEYVFTRPNDNFSSYASCVYDEQQNKSAITADSTANYPTDIHFNARPKSNNPGGDNPGGDNDGPITVQITGEVSVEDNTATWSFPAGNDEVAFSLIYSSNFIEGENSAPYYLTFDNADALKAISLTHDGPCNGEFEVVLIDNDPNTDPEHAFRLNFACPGDEAEANSTTYRLDLSNANLPQSNEFKLEVHYNNGGHQNPDSFSYCFDNVQDADAVDHAYVGVSSVDFQDSIFYIYSQNAEIISDNNNPQQATNYCVHFDSREDWLGASFRIRKDSFNPESMQLTARGPDGVEERFNTTPVGDYYVLDLSGVEIPGNINNLGLAIEGWHESHQGPEDEREPHPGDPTEATVTVTDRGLSGIDNSFYLGRVEINWEPVIVDQECEWDASNCPSTYTRENFIYNKEADVDTVEITFSTLFINKYIGDTVIVNNVPYPIGIDYADREDWLAHYGYQCTGFSIEVPYDEDGYDIIMDIDEAPGEEQQIGNFLWTNDEREKYRDNGELSDIYIGHSNLEVVAVNCHITSDDADDVYFVVGEDEVPAGCVFEYQPDDDEHPTGSLVVPEGSTVTVRLKTQYGWQVTGFRITEDEIQTDPGKTAQYSFGILRGNAHIGAITEPVKDEVNSESNIIVGGSITLGGEEIEEGTAMLTVGDANLSDEEMQQFQDEAGNYTVSNVLNIDLDQIFYNGKGGYWKGAEMKELGNEATITLTLDEGVDGNSVVLVHKKHDGTFEVIPTTYDTEKHTITFKTSSFSEYAIASATVANSNTLDKIRGYFVIFAVSASGIIALLSKKKETAKATE